MAPKTEAQTERSTVRKFAALLAGQSLFSVTYLLTTFGLTAFFAWALSNGADGAGAVGIMAFMAWIALLAPGGK